MHSLIKKKRKALSEIDNIPELSDYFVSAKELKELKESFKEFKVAKGKVFGKPVERFQHRVKKTEEEKFLHSFNDHWVAPAPLPPGHLLNFGGYQIWCCPSGYFVSGMSFAGLKWAMRFITDVSTLSAADVDDFSDLYPLSDWQP
jgi:hypothetical protein